MIFFDFIYRLMSSKAATYLVVVLQLAIFNPSIKAQTGVNKTEGAFGAEILFDNILADYVHAINIEVDRQMQATRDGFNNRDFAQIPAIGLLVDYENLNTPDGAKFLKISPEIENFLKVKRVKLNRMFFKMWTNADFGTIEKSLTAILDKLSEHESQFGSEVADWGLLARRDVLDSFDRLMILNWAKKGRDESSKGLNKRFYVALSALTFFGYQLTSLPYAEPLFTSDAYRYVAIGSVILSSIELTRLTLAKFFADRDTMIYENRLGVGAKNLKSVVGKASLHNSVYTKIDKNTQDLSSLQTHCKRALLLSKAMIQR